MRSEDKMSGRSGRVLQAQANARAQASQERQERRDEEAESEHEDAAAPPPPAVYSLWTAAKTNQVHPSSSSLAP